MTDLRNLPYRATSAFLIFSILWIGLSDWLVSFFPVEHQHFLQTTKGWFYVVVVALILLLFLKRSCHSVLKLQDDLTTKVSGLIVEHDSKHALFNAMPVSVWEEDFSAIKRYIDQEVQPKDHEQLRAWLDVDPERVALLAKKARVLSVGGTTLEMFAAESESQLLSNLQSVFTEKSLPSFKEEVLSFYRGEYFYNAETEQCRLTGESFLTSTSVCVPEVARESWDRVIVAIEDITRKHEAQKAIDSFFDLDMNLHLIASMDEGIILRVNQGWKTALGYEKEELQGRSFLNFIHEDDLPKSFNELSSLEQGQKTHYFENRYRHKEGEYRTLSWSAVVPSGTGLLYGVASDITDKKQAENRLRDAALVINSTSEGGMLTDLSGTIQEVNTAFTKITGFYRDEAIGKTPSILKSGRHDKRFYSALWEQVELTGHWQGEIWNRNKNGEIYPELLTINQATDEEGNVCGYAGVFSDISHIKHAETRLTHLSTHDALTGLANRSLFTELVERALKHAHRTRKIVAVILLDLDNFKNINDSMGFDTGDELLKVMATRIHCCIRQNDVLARTSSDEFAILLEDIEYSKQVSLFTEKLLNHIKPAFVIDKKEIYLTASAGISLYPHDTEDTGTLIRNADTALTNAKEQGKGGYQFYSKELTAAAFEAMIIESAMRTALEKNQFFLVYQPQFRLEGKELDGMEVLIRWKHPELGLVPPGKFIPIAERSSLINEIGLWVLKEACQQGRLWLDQGYKFGRIAVNVSTPQVMRDDLIEHVVEILNQTSFPAENLELEVTETFAMKDPVQSRHILGSLRYKGIEIAIDDFGTGYSSLNYLKNLPIDKLKIDQSFVAGMCEEVDDVAIIEAITSLGKALNLRTIAEGIENEQQLILLKEKGCLLGQGYLYSRPIVAEEFEDNFLK